MATSAEDIATAILAVLESNPFFNVAHPVLISFITAIATGVYAGLQNLDDVSGQPPSTGHQ